MEYALRCEGYKCELLGNCGSAVAQLGLKYVHNDTCYPALLVIGQFLDALNSGKYDLEHTGPADHPDRRRLPRLQLHPSAAQGAGQGRLPRRSRWQACNFSGLEKDRGFQMTLPLARKCIACIFYGDLLMCAAPTRWRPYENEKGAADRMVDRWMDPSGPCTAGRQGLDFAGK